MSLEMFKWLIGFYPDHLENVLTWYVHNEGSDQPVQMMI